MGGAIECPLCGNNQAYCKCTRLEKEQFLELVRLDQERLTNKERGAINWAIAVLLHDADKTWPVLRERSKHSREAAMILKGLLDRLPPGGEDNE